jgi:hypothetical protein
LKIPALYGKKSFNVTLTRLGTVNGSSTRTAYAVAVLVFLSVLIVTTNVSADDLELYCYPNPAKLDGTRLTIVYELTADSTVTLRIYTIDGYEVKTVLDGVDLEASKINRKRWDFTNGAGEEVNPGVYVAVLRVTNSVSGEKTDRFVFILE